MTRNDTLRELIAWLEARYIALRDGPGNEVIRGAHMAAHNEVIDHLRALLTAEVDKPVQLPVVGSAGVYVHTSVGPTRYNVCLGCDTDFVTKQDLLDHVCSRAAGDRGVLWIDRTEASE